MKRKNITAAMALFMVSMHVWAVDEANDAQRVFAAVSPSVATVKTLDKQKALESQGSGVVVGAGLVATNCHVVQEAFSIRVLTAQDELAAEWTHHVPGLDLCLLYVPGLNAPSLKLRPSATLRTGEIVHAVGNPLGFGLAVSSGLLTVFEPGETNRLVISTAAQSPGSSGGGLFDNEGRLIGVTTAVLGTGQNLNQIIVADELVQLLENGKTRPPPSPVPSPEKNWYSDASKLEASGDWSALEQHAQAWSQLHAKSATPLVFLATAQIGLKRDAQGEATLRKALALDQHSVSGWAHLAYQIAIHGRQAEAEQALKKAEKKQPSYSQANRVRAEWLRQQGKLAEALGQIKESIRKYPGLSGAWNLMGEIQYDLDNTVEASHAFSTALRLERANADSKKHLADSSVATASADRKTHNEDSTDESNSEESNLQLNLGLSEMKRNRLFQAEEAIRKAIALSPKSSPAWNGLGGVLQRANRLQEADNAYTKAIELDPGNSEAFAHRSQTRSMLKRTDMALNDARRAIELSPQKRGGWRIYALIKFESRDYRESAAAFAKLDKLTQLSADDRVSWAESLAETGELNQALAMLKKVEETDPNLLRLCLSMAKVLGRKGDLEEALRYQDRALALDTTSVHAWSSKGYALMRLGRLPAAVEALETAVRLDPELSNAWTNLGEAQMRSRNLGRAIQALEKAIALEPIAMDARWFLAQSYLGVRMSVKSREQAQKILEIQPNFSSALGLITITYLMEGNIPTALDFYTKLKALSPSMASAVRNRSLAQGLLAAKELPE